MRGWLAPWLRILIVSLGGVLCTHTAVAAQSPPPPVATASQSFAFDYKDADLTAGAVTRFEMAVDGGTWATIGVPPVGNDALTQPGSKTYVVPIPALTTGTHTVAFRACNASICGDSSLPLSFVLAVKPATPTGLRIVGKP